MHLETLEHQVSYRDVDTHDEITVKLRVFGSSPTHFEFTVSLSGNGAYAQMLLKKHKSVTPLLYKGMDRLHAETLFQAYAERIRKTNGVTDKLTLPK